MDTGNSGAVAPDAPTVLAIDDEPGILRLLRLELTIAGMNFIPANTVEEGRALLESRHIDIVVLDIVTSRDPGFDALVQTKKGWPSLPVVVLTSTASDTLPLQIIEAGADDVVTKPFSPEDLTNRIRFLLGIRSGALEEDAPIRTGNVQIELRRETVTHDGDLVKLSRTEWMLLRRLVAANGEAALDQELLVKTWGPEYRTEVEYLRVWVDRLRSKLGDDPQNPKVIRRFQGVGYRFTADEPVRPSA